jgi:N-acetylglucosaminyldiphosphoundecaprenol N-acetyl-beta-D-mannosaminyltransferase
MCQIISLDVVGNPVPNAIQVMPEARPDSGSNAEPGQFEITQGLSEALTWTKASKSPVDVPTVKVFGLPCARVTQAETLDLVDRFILERTPRLIITANLHFAMLSQVSPVLRWLNRKADLVLADGMPLVWASRLKGRKNRLPERVTGADLVPALCVRAADLGHRVYFLGGADGVAEEAVRKVRETAPDLNVIGIEAPHFSKLSTADREALVARIHASRPDLLFVALGQPKGELWLAENLENLGVPVSIQIGASLDFLAGRVKRAPIWVQRIGMEWFWRLASEPGRLFSRYASNAVFLLRKIFRGKGD